METEIYDRHGGHAPTMTVAELRRYSGKFWKLVDRRGTVGISQDGEIGVVALSLDQFVSILFGMQPRVARKKRSGFQKKQGKRRIR